MNTTPENVILMCDSRISQVSVKDQKEEWIDLSLECPELNCDLSRSSIQHLSKNPFQVRKTVAQQLLEAQSLLPAGVRLQIKECYRPLWVQKRFWLNHTFYLQSQHPEWSPSEVEENAAQYVAPVSVAPHATGGAVDLILIDSQGIPLDMGTAFNASPSQTENRTYTDCSSISAKAITHRQFLVNAMIGAGFVNYPTEWWHWSFGDQYWGFCLNREALYPPRRLEFFVRPAVAGDEETLAEINVRSSKSTYRGILKPEFLERLSVDRWKPVVQKRIADPNITCLVATETESGQVIGYADFGPARSLQSNCDSELYAIYLLEEFQGFGAGQLLFETGLRELKKRNHRKMEVSVFSANRGGQNFYQKLCGKLARRETIQMEGGSYETTVYEWDLESTLN